MDTVRGRACSGPLRLLALAVAHSRRLALLVGGRPYWQRNAGYTFMPAELPGTVHEPDATAQATADEIARRTLGRATRLIASRQLYGPSEAHRMDRLPASLDDVPLPLLRLEREAPLYVAATPMMRCVMVTVYRARLAGPPALSATRRDAPAGLLWLSPEALRLAMRGMPFTDLLAQPAVEWQPASAETASAAMPDDALIYVPADYGERHLLRLVAKYGPEALFQGEDRDWDDDAARLAYSPSPNP
jgi:hypothetical protein